MRSGKRGRLLIHEGAVECAALLPVALLSVALLPVALLSVAIVACRNCCLLPVALLPVALLPVALLSVALLPVALLPVALLPVALLPVALLPVALLSVALLSVACCTGIHEVERAASDRDVGVFQAVDDRVAVALHSCTRARANSPCALAGVCHLPRAQSHALPGA
jgi:hypothetical protein